MDQQMLTRLLQTYPGAAQSPANMNRAREFFASNPEIAEKRAMGMRGSGLDDNSDVFGPMLDKIVADTAAPTVTQEALPPLPAVANATVPTRRTATAASNKSYPAPNEASGAPLQTGGIPGDYNAPGTPAEGGFQMGVADYLKFLLGFGAASAGAGTALAARPPGPGGPEATFVGRMQHAADNDPRGARAYLPKGASGALPSGGESFMNDTDTLPGQPKRPSITNRAMDPANVESIGQETDQINNRNRTTKEARTRAVQADVDSENETIMRQIMERNELAKRQGSTRSLLDAARAALGRR